MNNKKQNLDSFRKTSRMVTKFTNTLGFKVKDEITKTSFLIPQNLQRNIRQVRLVKDPNSITQVAVSFHMANGKINTFPLHCENSNKSPEMLQIMAKKNYEITNLNHLICHKEGNQTYYSLNK